MSERTVEIAISLILAVYEWQLYEMNRQGRSSE